MPVQINEIIIRAIVTTDDKRSVRVADIAGKKTDNDEEERKKEILDLIDESLKNRNER
ncbi:MAG TPA: DUF5908 family protein [Flavisolibacter sp.]|jgi:hypothetical protein|nr:DUF5908 family protein [Flavisolibacter sp.]